MRTIVFFNTVLIFTPAVSCYGIKITCVHFVIFDVLNHIALPLARCPLPKNRALGLRPRISALRASRVPLR